jgi:virginiamycin B lyase
VSRGGVVSGCRNFGLQTVPLAVALIIGGALISSAGGAAAAQSTPPSRLSALGAAYCTSQALPGYGVAGMFSFDNVYACGPDDSNGSTPYDENGDQSFQCEELSIRFLWAIYGIWAGPGVDSGSPYYGAGAYLVDLVHQDIDSKIPVGTPGPGSVPAPGDVISFGPGGAVDPSVGHTGVVISGNPSTGEFETMSENFSSDDTDGTAGEQFWQVALNGSENGKVQYLGGPKHPFSGAWTPSNWLALSSLSNGTANDYTDPSIYTPESITAGPDGALWFTNDGPEGNDSIGRITTAGVVTNYTDPRIDDFLEGITTGPDGSLWFTEYAGGVGRITTAGVVTNYYPVSGGQDITTGPDGELWFTDSNNDVVRMTTEGVVTAVYSSPSINEPGGITTGPDGAVWFTNSGSDSIGQITTDGVMTFYTGSSIVSPSDITTGPDGALWFTNGNGSIGRITTNGVVTSYPTPAGVTPDVITTGPDGALWFTNESTPEPITAYTPYPLGSIGRITTAGVVTEYTSGVDGPGDITIGPDGALWFTNDPANGDSGSIGQTGVFLSQTIASPAETVFSTTQPNTFTVTTTGTEIPKIEEKGKLPSGVHFSNNKNGSAILSGTPRSSAGTYELTIIATFGKGKFKQVVSQPFSLTIT